MAETISDKRVLKKILWTKPQNMWSICKSFLRKEKIEIADLHLFPNSANFE